MQDVIIKTIKSSLRFRTVADAFRADFVAQSDKCEFYKTKAHEGTPCGHPSAKRTMLWNCSLDSCPLISAEEEVNATMEMLDTPGWKEALGLANRDGKVVPENIEEPISVANLPPEFVFTPEQVKRIMVLLRSVSKLIEKCEDGPYVKNAPALEIITDEYVGDGHSLMVEIDNLLSEIDN